MEVRAFEEYGGWWSKGWHEPADFCAAVTEYEARHRDCGDDYAHWAPRVERYIAQWRFAEGGGLYLCNVPYGTRGAFPVTVLYTEG